MQANPQNNNPNLSADTTITSVAKELECPPIIITQNVHELINYNHNPSDNFLADPGVFITPATTTLGHQPIPIETMDNSPGGPLDDLSQNMGLNPSSENPPIGVAEKVVYTQSSASLLASHSTFQQYRPRILARPAPAPMSPSASGMAVVIGGSGTAIRANSAGGNPVIFVTTAASSQQSTPGPAVVSTVGITATKKVLIPASGTRSAEVISIGNRIVKLVPATGASPIGSSSMVQLRGKTLIPTVKINSSGVGMPVTGIRFRVRPVGGGSVVVGSPLLSQPPVTVAVATPAPSITFTGPSNMSEEESPTIALVGLSPNTSSMSLHVDTIGNNNDLTVYQHDSPSPNQFSSDESEDVHENSQIIHISESHSHPKVSAFKEDGLIRACKTSEEPCEAEKNSKQPNSPQEISTVSEKSEDDHIINSMTKSGQSICVPVRIGKNKDQEELHVTDLVSTENETNSESDIGEGSDELVLEDKAKDLKSEIGYMEIVTQGELIKSGTGLRTKDEIIQDLSESIKKTEPNVNQLIEEGISSTTIESDFDDKFESQLSYELENAANDKETSDGEVKLRAMNVQTYKTKYQRRNDKQKEIERSRKAALLNEKKKKIELIKKGVRDAKLAFRSFEKFKTDDMKLGKGMDDFSTEKSDDLKCATEMKSQDVLLASEKMTKAVVELLGKSKRKGSDSKGVIGEARPHSSSSDRDRMNRANSPKTNSAELILNDSTGLIEETMKCDELFHEISRSSSRLNEPEPVVIKPVLRWADGVGALPGSDLKFRVNEFGVFELIQPGDPIVTTTVKDEPFVIKTEDMSISVPPQEYVDVSLKSEDIKVEMIEANEEVNEDPEPNSIITRSGRTPRFQGQYFTSVKRVRREGGRRSIRNNPRASKILLKNSPDVAFCENCACFGMKNEFIKGFCTYSCSEPQGITAPAERPPMKRLLRHSDRKLIERQKRIKMMASASKTTAQKALLAAGLRPPPLISPTDDSSDSENGAGNGCDNENVTFIQNGYKENGNNIDNGCSTEELSIEDGSSSTEDERCSQNLDRNGIQSEITNEGKNEIEADSNASGNGTRETTPTNTPTPSMSELSSITLSPAKSNSPTPPKKSIVWRTPEISESPSKLFRAKSLSTSSSTSAENENENTGSQLNESNSNRSGRVREGPKKVKAERLTRNSSRISSKNTKTKSPSSGKKERKRSFERVLNSRMPHLKQNSSDGPDQTTEIGGYDTDASQQSGHGQDTSTRSGRLSGVSEHNWSKYLTDTKSKPAPLRLFRQPAMPDANPFKKGMMLEAIDPQHQSLFCVARVVETQGYRLRLRLVGFSESYDFWVNADSDEIFPCGWCEENAQELQQPPGENNFSWHQYLVENQTPAADRQFFEVSREDPLQEKTVRIGMKLEAVDIRNQKFICVASVALVIGDRFLVHFDSWDSMYDYWTDLTSPYIHPVGYCERSGENLITPNHSKTNTALFTWDKYLRSTKSVAMPSQLFQPLPPVPFKTGMKLECVDKRNPFLVRVATITDVSGHELGIHFDGWSEIYDYDVYELSPDIHPVGWCAHTGHALQPPPVQNQKWTGPCPTFGCIGLGHIKGPKFLTHNTDKNCPYADNNYTKDWPQTDRLVAYEKSCSLVDKSQASQVGSEEKVVRKKPKLTKVVKEKEPDIPLETPLPTKRTRISEPGSAPKRERDSPKATAPKKVPEEMRAVHLIPEKKAKPVPIIPEPPVPVPTEQEIPSITPTLPTLPIKSSPGKKLKDVLIIPRRNKREYKARLSEGKVSELSDGLLKATLESGSGAKVSRVRPKASTSVWQGITTSTNLVVTSASSTILPVTIVPTLGPLAAPKLILAPQFSSLLGSSVTSDDTEVPSQKSQQTLPGPVQIVTTNIIKSTTVFGEKKDSIPSYQIPAKLQGPAGPAYLSPLAINNDHDIDLPVNYAVHIRPLADIVGHLSTAVVSKWSKDNVKTFISRIPGCVHVAKRFAEQMIDGEAFLLLNQGDLTDVMEFKMGPVIKLAHVIRLIHANSVPVI